MRMPLTFFIVLDLGWEKKATQRENVQGSGGENNMRLRERMCCGEDELSDGGGDGDVGDGWGDDGGWVPMVSWLG
jgi:hypothetical protein